MPYPRVLIIEDAASNAAVMQRLIERRLGWAVAGLATTGREGLVLADTIRPNIITLDLTLPDYAGFDCLQALRSRTEAQILVVSSSTREGSPVTTEALRSGADAWFDKNKLITHLDDFVALIARLGNVGPDASYQ